MSFWSAIVLIVLITAVAGIFRNRSSIEGRGTLPEAQDTSARERELEYEVEALRERVKVLERIATDPARRTAEEIEKLRDE
ncbi:hypothetical protein [Aurantiacibacter zhengii]|uniref:Envelope stress response membrane protein PspB n=1 Tax=Aurantiacibacter zhengii TaxID=2307003 RepID=A0A418NUN1_9SPHN|nr:hypothetical protein [Aurantiacibacter zhengii]RIV87786.1 hypothetical protein D2V07_05510 [Aurantiacibacter zhengii]